MHNFPQRKEFDLHVRQGSSDAKFEDWVADYNELKERADIERLHYFTEHYGENLGSVAARFADLSILPIEVEEAERRTLLTAVEEAMTNSSEDVRRNPIIAVLEASELRSYKNYLPPEHRSDKPVRWMQIDYEFEGLNDSQN